MGMVGMREVEEGEEEREEGEEEEGAHKEEALQNQISHLKIATRISPLKHR